MKNKEPNPASFEVVSTSVKKQRSLLQVHVYTYDEPLLILLYSVHPVFTRLVAAVFKNFRAPPVEAFIQGSVELLEW